MHIYKNGKKHGKQFWVDAYGFKNEEAYKNGRRNGESLKVINYSYENDKRKSDLKDYIEVKEVTIRKGNYTNGRKDGKFI